MILYTNQEANMAYIDEKKEHIFDKIADDAERKVQALMDEIFETIQTKGSVAVFSRVKRSFSGEFEQLFFDGFLLIII